MACLQIKYEKNFLESMANPDQMPYPFQLSGYLLFKKM
jgi:hypothetical protein